MQVYGNTLSPFVRKTMAYVSEKGIDVEFVAMIPNSDDAGFREASPFGKIPGFRDGDFAISDSTAIITYLEAKTPQPPLIPTEPMSRARTIWYEEFADTILAPCLATPFFHRILSPMFFGRPGDEAAAIQAEKEAAPPLLDYLERTIPASGFLVDGRLTLADLAVASPFVNFHHGRCAVDKDRHPRTAAYVETILARPSFALMVAQEEAMLGG